ncbi:hypothetical protein PI124_g5980 [Phytophthora idaei]|nr:hypothetical protein PI125_g6842 [Phytophthora idaei]KAG3161407.1 hypothetical protein PI126_g6475 [Phytophthora idaei]KAG3249362.1 hypothetical protein PI124_g5980 [Phytophthora idaei]
MEGSGREQLHGVVSSGGGGGDGADILRGAASDGGGGGENGFVALLSGAASGCGENGAADTLRGAASDGSGGDDQQLEGGVAFINNGETGRPAGDVAVVAVRAVQDAPAAERAEGASSFTPKRSGADPKAPRTGRRLQTTLSQTGSAGVQQGARRRRNAI